MKHLSYLFLLLFSLLLEIEPVQGYAKSSGRGFPINVMPNSLPLDKSDSAFIKVPMVGTDSIISCYVTKYSELEFLIIYRYPSQDCICTVFEGFIADAIYIGRNVHVKLEDD